MMVRFSRRVAVAAAVPALGLALIQGQASAATPEFEMPFPCGQVWTGATFTDHSPANAVDFNRDNDEGDTVVAAADGKVSRVENEGNTSYGRWIELDHGAGWTTRYAHLSSQDVKVGDAVKQGSAIGKVGNTGGSSGAHLHFEELSGGTPAKITLSGDEILYWGKKEYKSKNHC